MATTILAKSFAFSMEKITSVTAMTTMLMTMVGTSHGSIGSISALTMILTMVGMSHASMGAIRKVRFEERPDSIYRAVSCSDDEMPFRTSKGPLETLFP